MFFLKTLNKDASLSKACVAFVLHPEHLNLLSHTNSIELHIDITCEYCDVISFFRPGFLLEEPLCKASFPFVAGKVQQPGQIALQGSSWTLVKCSKEGIRKGVSTDFNYCKYKPQTFFSSDDLIHGTCTVRLKRNEAPDLT